MRSATLSSGLAATAALWLTSCSGSPPSVGELGFATVEVTSAPPTPPAKTVAVDAPPDVPSLDDDGPWEEPEPIAFSPPPSSQKTTPKTTKATAKTTLRPRWKTKVGLGTFRTTMALVGRAVIIGTHGSTLDKLDEKDDGVYVLDAITGKVQRFIATPASGDRDVGGVAIDGDVVFFTGDASLVAAASLSTGAAKWSVKLGGKVRPAPALGDVNGDGGIDVVVGDEMGTIAALDGATGARIWSTGTGQNDYGAAGFIGAAAIVDVDGDGKDDVVAGARDGALTAYRGRDGRVLWRVVDQSGMHASPQVTDLDGDGKREILAAWSYSDFGFFDVRTGAERQGQQLSLDAGGIEGLFATPVPLPTGRGGGGVWLGSAWWGKEDGVTIAGPKVRLFRSEEGRTTSSAVVADLDGDGAPEAIFVTEAGKLVAVSAEGARAELAKLAGKPETTPMLADADGDGALELYVLDGAGTLTCWDTGAKTQALVSRFRGESPHNRGELGVRMRFELATPVPPKARPRGSDGEPAEGKRRRD